MYDAEAQLEARGCNEGSSKEFCNRGRGLSGASLQATPPLQTSLGFAQN